MAVGVVVFLATDSLMAGAVLPSLRAGWRSLHTGGWILRADPRRSRAWICGAFCLATAFWQAAAAALGSVIMFVAVALLTGNAPNLERFAVTMLTLSSGVVLTVVVGLAASIAAVTVSLRVWVHPRLHDLVRGDLRRLAASPRSGRVNHAIFVLAISLACPVLVVCGLLLTVVRSGLFTAVVLIVGLLLVCIGYVWLGSRVIAAGPGDCWQ